MKAIDQIIDLFSVMDVSDDTLGRLQQDTEELNKEKESIMKSSEDQESESEDNEESNKKKENKRNSED